MEDSRLGCVSIENCSHPVRYTWVTDEIVNIQMKNHHGIYKRSVKIIFGIFFPKTNKKSFRQIFENYLWSMKSLRNKYRCGITRTIVAILVFTTEYRIITLIDSRCWLMTRTYATNQAIYRSSDPIWENDCTRLRAVGEAREALRIERMCLSLWKQRVLANVIWFFVSLRYMHLPIAHVRYVPPLFEH